jgi:hypothetical protein
MGTVSNPHVSFEKDRLNMQILTPDTIMVNPANGQIARQVDMTMDATDTAATWGWADGSNGAQQSAFCFPDHSEAWWAYHNAYRDGAVLAAILTGETRRWFDPEFPLETQSLTWRAPICPDNLPFQTPVECFPGAPADWPTVEEVEAIEAQGYGYA